MDVAPAHGHVYEEEAHRRSLHSVIEGGEGEHHEKKSVLKKVKDKAKKIKDTIGKKRHGPHGAEEHGHGSRSSEEEEEEGYVEDDEGEQEPEVHGAPIYESEAARGFVSSHGGDLGKEMLAAGRLEEDPGAPKPGAGEVVPGSYQTGAVGSASPGGPEPGVIRSFQALSVSDQPGKEEEEASAAPTGSHDQFSPESRPAHGEEAPGTGHSVSGEAGPERRETQEQQPHSEKSYTEKISSATSAIVEKASHAKDAAVSAAVGSAEYSKKIAETVYEKVGTGGLASALGSGAAAPPLQQKQEEGEKEQAESFSAGAAAAAAPGAEETDKLAKRVSMREYLAEKLSPGEEDRALCEVISEAMQKRKENERDVREKAEETTAASAPGEKKAGKGMVGKIKGAVTSLCGGSHGHPAQARVESMDSSQVEQGGGPTLQQESTS
ncbi:hypothetical protein Taro_015095 [Colocasia esculenta]|uniref:Uncharacterized protein n=1 Tax=Colocasia esculenta TaxID=4460 RepID=A0A843UGN1_COLES|nr:hypothetical protein [Colocasia esculenta]